MKLTNNLKLLLDFSGDIDVVSPNSFDGEQASAIQRYFCKDGGVAKVQVRIGAERHLTGSDPARTAFFVLLAPHSIGR